MNVFISVEGQHCQEIGLADILKDTVQKLNFLIDKSNASVNAQRYGEEFQLISIIPSCVDDEFWEALGWKERTYISRKKREADIRLRMDYKRFVNESDSNKKLLFYGVIVKSIRAVEERSKSDFLGENLIRDVLLLLNVSAQDVERASV